LSAPLLAHDHGAEVDVLLATGNRITCVLEIKSSQNIVKERLAELRSFIADNPSVPTFVLGVRQNRRELLNNITIINRDVLISEEPSPLSDGESYMGNSVCKGISLRY